MRWRKRRETRRSLLLCSVHKTLPQGTPRALENCQQSHSIKITTRQFFRFSVFCNNNWTFCCFYVSCPACKSVKIMTTVHTINKLLPELNVCYFPPAHEGNFGGRERTEFKRNKLTLNERKSKQEIQFHPGKKYTKQTRPIWYRQAIDGNKK